MFTREQIQGKGCMMSSLKFIKWVSIFFNKMIHAILKTWETYTYLGGNTLLNRFLNNFINLFNFNCAGSSLRVGFHL